MHHMKLIRLNIRLVALLALTGVVLLAASALTPPRQAAAMYTNPEGVLCFRLVTIGGNALPGIGLVRIDHNVNTGDGNPNDITFASEVKINDPSPTCQEVQDPVDPGSTSSGAALSFLTGKWVPGTHTLTATVCAQELEFGGVSLGPWARVEADFILPADPTGKTDGSFSIFSNVNPVNPSKFNCPDTGSTVPYVVVVQSGPFLAGPGGAKSSYTSDWDKDGCTDWEELDPDALGPSDPFKFSNICLSGVGGVAELAEAAGTPLEAPGSSGTNVGLIAGIVAAIAAGTVTLGGAAWYTRRRSIQ